MSDAPAVILFDLDDTLVDDSGSATECWQRAFAEHATPPGLELEVRQVGVWYWADPERHRVGRADLPAASTTIVAAALERLGCPDRELASRIAVRYRALRDEAIDLFPGAVETLERLRGDGVVLGLITNGGAGAQRAKIDRFGLEPLFDYVGIEGARGFGKPDPRAYATAVDSLGCDPAETWMVGDNLERDVLAPQRHGIAGVWVNPSMRDPAAGAPLPWRVIGSVTELV